MSVHQAIINAKSLGEFLRRVTQFYKERSVNPAAWGTAYQKGSPAYEFLVRYLTIAPSNALIASQDEITVSCFVDFLVTNWSTLFVNNRISDQAINDAKASFDAISRRKVSCRKVLDALRTYFIKSMK